MARNLTWYACLLVVILTATGVPALAQGYFFGGLTSELAEVAAQVNPGQASGQDQTPDRTSPPKPHPNPLQDRRDRIYYPGDTESFKPLVLKLAGNIILDQKSIWTSPFHMHASDAPWWIGFGGATAALIATDHKTLLEADKARTSWSENFSKIGASYTLLPVLAGFYSFGVFNENPKARETGILGAEALVDSLIVSSVLKPIAGRNRPDALKDRGAFFDGGSGFPSGHAIEVWSLASVISHEYGHTKFVPIVAVGLASIVSAARFTAQRHYASDIVAGGAMGWFIGRYVWKTHQDHAIHPHGKLNAQIAPQFQPSTRTYGVAVTLGK
jgi:membrane-associated phospholipid phosphatase